MRLALGSRSRLVSVETGGHVIAFNARNGCADGHATAFLVDGVLPRDPFCERDAVATARQQEPVADGLLSSAFTPAGGSP
jgi:TAP-like protein